MDINVALDRMLAACELAARHYQKLPDNHELSLLEAEAVEMIDSFEAIHEWLSGKGFLPKKWER